MQALKLWISAVVLGPIKNNPAISLLVAGLLLYLTGISKTPYLGSETGQHLKEFGLAIVSAGVFTCILKSAQFSSLFQEHILTAFYDPASMADNQVLQDRWLLLTNSILRGLLPISYNKAAEAIMGRFLDASLDYHFSDFEISYSIGVDANGKATVLNMLKADLVISPNRPQAIFTQNIESDSPSKLLSLILDNTPIDLAQLVAAPTGADKTKLTLTLNLLEHIGNDKRSVRFERTFSTAQDIHSEPFISATISRFIKGAVIRNRI